MLDRRLLKMLDVGLIIIIVVLFLFSLIMINSATNLAEQGFTRQVKVQSIAFVIGIFFIHYFNDRLCLGKFYKAIYIVSILMLLLVYPWIREGSIWSEKLD